MSQFERCVAAKYAYAIVDLVSRVDRHHLGLRGHRRPGAGPVHQGPRCRRAAQRRTGLADLDDQAVGDDNPAAPLLLAISDNGSEMKCRDTRRFMAICSIAQHFGPLVCV